MGEFNSDDHYIYYCGQESINRQWVMQILNILSCVSFGKLYYSDTLSNICFQIVGINLCMCMYTQSCLTLWEPIDCSLPGSSVHGILHQGSWIFSTQGSMAFSRQDYWSGVLFPSPKDSPNPGIKPWSPALQADSLPSEPQGSPY